MAFIKVIVWVLRIVQILAKHQSGQDVLIPHSLNLCRHVIHLPLNVRAENVNSFIQGHENGLTILGNSSDRMPQRIWDHRASCLVHVISSSIDSIVGSFLTVAKFRQDDKAEYELFIALNAETQFKWIKDALPGILPYLQRGVSLWFQQTPDNRETDYKINLNYKEMHRLKFHCSSVWLACLFQLDLTSTLKTEPGKLNYFGWPLYIYIKEHFQPSYNFGLIQTLPFWQLFIRKYNDFKMPIGKLCSDIAKYINATATMLFQEAEISSEYLSLLVPDSTMTGIASCNRPLVNSIEKLNFMYCKSKDQIISSGQLTLYLCPFDRSTWLLVILTLAGTALTLKVTNGNSHILNLVRCLLLQAPDGYESLKKTVWVFCLWMFATLIVTALYTNFIESILVVPIKMSGPETFEELYLANYTIILPDSDDEFIDDLFRRDNSPFSGMLYLDKLCENAEYIHAPFGFPSPGFIVYAVTSENRAMVFEQKDLEILKFLVKSYAPDAECKVGRELVMSEMKMWAGLGGHAAALRSILHQLFVGGLVDYMADGSHRALTKATTSYVPLLSHYGGVNGSGMIMDGFVMENAQFRMLFLSWLVGLGGSAAVFLLEIQANCCSWWRLFRKLL